MHACRLACVAVAFVLITIVDHEKAIAQTGYFNHNESGRLTQMSYGFNALRPEKVIAFITNKGCCYIDRRPNEAALQTPGLLIAGELDTQVRRDSIRGLFNDNRPRGALWSWVEAENTAHARADDELVLPFMAEAIRLRYLSGELPTATVAAAGRRSDGRQSEYPESDART